MYRVAILESHLSLFFFRVLWGCFLPFLDPKKTNPSFFLCCGLYVHLLAENRVCRDFKKTGDKLSEIALCVEGIYRKMLFNNPAFHEWIRIRDFIPVPGAHICLEVVQVRSNGSASQSNTGKSLRFLHRKRFFLMANKDFPSGWESFSIKP